MIALGLDLGDHMGWGYWDHGKVTSGAENFKGKAMQSDGIRFMRMTEFLDKLRHRPHIIYFEEVRRHTGVKASHVYGGYQSVLTMWCQQKKVEFLGLPVGTIKKHWCGMGNADKEAMVLQAVKRGFSVRTHDQADGLAILHTGVELFPYHAF